MRVVTGTSGFSFKEWKGAFYPADLPDRQMLPYYSARLGAVEINATFYRMPKPETVRAWGDAVPPGFCFALKAPQRITHKERLVGSEGSLAAFLRAATVLGPSLGAVLFQLPPFFRKDTDKLAAFLALVPPGTRVAFEFRHPSWYDEDTYAVLRERDVALVGGDADDEGKSPPFVPTASFGYLRLRAPAYTEAELAAWSERVRAAPWKEALVFLKHEVKGPEWARRLAELAGA